MAEEHFDELYRRTNVLEKDVALTAQRIDIHEKNCMEKHEAVLNKLKQNAKDFANFREEHQKFINRWMIGLLTTLLVAAVTIILKSS